MKDETKEIICNRSFCNNNSSLRTYDKNSSSTVTLFHFQNTDQVEPPRNHLIRSATSSGALELGEEKRVRDYLHICDHVYGGVDQHDKENRRPESDLVVRDLKFGERRNRHCGGRGACSSCQSAGLVVVPI